MSCDGATGYSMVASPFALAVGGQRQETFYAQWSSGGQYDYTSQMTWSSSNPGVATVQAGLGHGVSAGSVTFSASDHYIADYTPYQCYSANMSCPIAQGGGGTGPGYVGPYQVEPISIIAQGTITPGECPTGGSYPGYVKQVTNQVQDIAGASYPHSVTVADNITVGSRHDLGGGTSTGSATTGSDGSFEDTYSVCSSACPGSTGETDAVQNWTVNGVPLFHVNSIIYKCSSISVDGH